MGTTIKLLAQGCSELDDVFIDKSKDSLELMLASRQQDKTDEISTKKKNIVEVLCAEYAVVREHGTRITCAFPGGQDDHVHTAERSG